MEGAPLFNPEDNSESDDSEQIDGRNDKKSKKRKKGTVEWLQRLLKPDETKTPEESPETNRFLEAIKNPFGRLFGIEKEELTEDETASVSDTESRHPFIPSPYMAQETTSGRPVTFEEDNEVEVSLPQGLLINEDTAEEIASWKTESIRPIDEEDNAQYDQTMPEELQTESIQRIPESDTEVNRLRAEVENHAMAGAEIHNAHRLEEVGPMASTRLEASPVKERDIIIEKRGGAGAAAVGFVAAELLSRSRDKKIRREAKQLKKKVENLENNVGSDAIEAKRVESRNKEQLRELKERRLAQKPVKSPEFPVAPHASAEQPSPEKVYSPRTESPADSKEPSSTEKNRHYPDAAPKPEITQYDRIQEQKQEILAKIHEAGEQRYAGETYYERRHEVKDEPTLREQTSGVHTTPYGSGSWGVHPDDSDGTPPASAATPKTPEPNAPDQYKQAMVQGATTGIILLVGFVIVLILWSLL